MPLDEYDDILERRRQKRAARRFHWLMAILVGVGCLFLTAIVVLTSLALHSSREQTRRKGLAIAPRDMPADSHPAPPVSAARSPATVQVQRPKSSPIVEQKPVPPSQTARRPVFTSPLPPTEVAPAPNLPALSPIDPTEFPRSLARPRKEFLPGYYRQNHSGFNVLISRLAYTQSDEADGRPLGFLEAEFTRMSQMLPEKTIKTLAKVPVWVEWDHTLPRLPRDWKRDTVVLGVYYSSWNESLLDEGIDPRKQRCVCLLSLRAAFEARLKGRKGMVVLHEMAHAVHDQILGLDNSFVENAYRQAMNRELYLHVRHTDLTVRKAYAARNRMEYFAEITCAYLDRLDYTPVNRAELKDYDSVGYELMTKVWGTPEQITARKKKNVPLLK